jgi:hypothetical protein
MTAIAVGVEMMSRSLGILGEWKEVIDLPGFILLLITIIVVGIPVFWLANLFMRWIEKLSNPSIYDHFRQSLFFYLILIYCFISWMAGGFGITEEDAYLLLWAGISSIGILVNYRFLFRERRESRQ